MLQRNVELKQRQPVSAGGLDGFPEILQRLYLNRGVIHARECMNDMKDLLHPTKLMNVDKASHLLASAIDRQERILVVGDFDADGATASAVALRGLRLLGAQYVDFLVPNRFKYGYGLTPEIVSEAESKKPDLIITVDNGISSIDGVAAARRNGWKVLITDHHLPGGELPDANVIVNPNQEGDSFPSKSLAGVGVIFYVLAGLRAELEAKGWFRKRGVEPPNLAQLLDLVALGTVADVVPLDWNNRILIEQGLQRIRAGQCVPGITALIRLSGREQNSISASDLGFAVAPRLNAAGRIEDMSIGIECLLSDDVIRAQAFAERLDSLNRERRAIEDEMKESALVLVESIIQEVDHDGLPLGICLFDASWHQGVIGILASRLKEAMHRPVIAFAPDKDSYVKGSARSITGLHIRDVLDLVATRSPGLLTRFGGHAMAAGLTLKEERLDDFRIAFNLAVSEMINEEMLTSVVWTDGALSAPEMTLSTARLLQQSGPWGQAFPEPVFEGTFTVLNRRIVGERHLKLQMRYEPEGKVVDAIHFFFEEALWPDTTNSFKLAYKLAVNSYRGEESVQLIVEHAIPLD